MEPADPEPAPPMMAADDFFAAPGAPPPIEPAGADDAVAAAPALEPPAEPVEFTASFDAPPPVPPPASDFEDAAPAIVAADAPAPPPLAMDDATMFSAPSASGSQSDMTGMGGGVPSVDGVASLGGGSLGSHGDAPAGSAIDADAFGGAAYDAPVGSAPTMEQEQFSSNAMAEWRAEQARLIAEKDAAEQRELQVIREEAQAERELMYSQREKQLDAAFKTNRERQESVVQDMELKGWEAVVNLSSDSNLVPGSTADLAKYKALLTRLKHKEPEAFSAAV
jgi:hypothetical protein